jgi:hypothetical protein
MADILPLPGQGIYAKKPESWVKGKPISDFGMSINIDNENR